jgi:hypothetical protein
LAHELAGRKTSRFQIHIARQHLGRELILAKSQMKLQQCPGANLLELSQCQCANLLGLSQCFGANLLVLKQCPGAKLQELHQL